MSMPRLVVLISGTGSNLQALIDAQQAGTLGGDIVAVISNKANALGLERAQVAGIDTDVLAFAPFKPRPFARIEYDKTLAELINGYCPDLVILAGFMRILSAEFLEKVQTKVINLHPALPGAYAGLNAMERAWEDYQNAGLDRAGVMMHEVIEAVDMGPVLDTSDLRMSDYASFEAFKAAMHQLEHELIVRVVRAWCAQKK